jgi:alkylation response protein AidB-like acyl-CoA dehydrogenase
MSARQIAAIAEQRVFIAEQARLADAARRLPEALTAWMLAEDLFAILQPQRWGGLELPMQAALDVIEALSAVDGSAGWCLLKGSTSNQLAAYLPQTGAAAIWADPRIVVGGSFNPKGTAVMVDGGYRLTGRWDWGTGTTHSAWIMGGAVVIDGATGAPLPAPHGGPTIKTLFFPRGQVTFFDTWHTHGMRGTGSLDFAVTDVLVPADRAIDGPMARPVIETAHTSVPLIAQVMVPHAAVAIGIARGAMAAFVNLARGKTALMASSKLAEDKLVQDGVGRALALIDGARAYVQASVARAWSPDATPADYPALSLSAVQATHACVEAVDILYRLAGGSVVASDSAITRAWHDIHVAASHFLVNHDKYGGAGKALLAGAP